MWPNLTRTSEIFGLLPLFPLRPNADWSGILCERFPPSSGYDLHAGWHAILLFPDSCREIYFLRHSFVLSHKTLPKTLPGGRYGDISQPSGSSNSSDSAIGNKAHPCVGVPLARGFLGGGANWAVFIQNRRKPGILELYFKRRFIRDKNRNQSQRRSGNVMFQATCFRKVPFRFQT